MNTPPMNTPPSNADLPATSLPQSLEPTGVPQLDFVLVGGLPRGALVILLAPPGSGKPTLASQIAFAAANRGQRALFLTALSEPTIKLLEHLQGYRFFDRDLIGSTVHIFSLQQFLSQPFHVAEQFTGRPGKYVKLADTVTGSGHILADGNAQVVLDGGNISGGTLQTSGAGAIGVFGGASGFASVTSATIAKNSLIFDDGTLTLPDFGQAS